MTKTTEQEEQIGFRGHWSSMEIEEFYVFFSFKFRDYETIKWFHLLCSSAPLFLYLFFIKCLPIQMEFIKNTMFSV